MNWADGVAAALLICVSGCVHPVSASLVDRETSYRLVSVDGRPAGERGFTILFDPSGTYRASFDCAEHFGRYVLGTRLVLEAGGTAPGACDEIDLRSGQAIARQVSFGSEFLNDQPFRVARSGSELTLTGRRHSYVLAVAAAAGPASFPL